ncbi:hypothetical protein JCM8547_005498 [Rhodosporidiobolus lusitaniae]
MEQKSLRAAQRCEWRLDVTTKRIDTNPPNNDWKSESGTWIPAKVTVRKAVVPLLDLFWPPYTAKDDMKEYGDNKEGGLEEYLDEHYLKKGHKVFEERAHSDMLQQFQITEEMWDSI